MRIRCDDCTRAHEVVQVSPDYDPKRHLKFVATALTLTYELDGEIVDRYLLSPSFAQTHGLKPGTRELPDDYPPWTNEIVALCKPSFDSRGRT